MTDDASDHGGLDLREQIVRIDKMISEIDRTRQEIQYQPWLAVFSGMAAGGALFAAGVAFMKLLGG